MAIAGIPNPGAYGYAPAPVRTSSEEEVRLPEAAPWSADADDPALEALVRKMMVATSAEGAAIALRQGEAIVCRATAGNAPKLGVGLNAESGLSGRCLRTGEVVLCRDSETDPSVNAEACRALRMRAALLVPVKRTGPSEGLLAVFSSIANIFDEGDVATLRRLAEIAAQFLPEELKEAVPEAPPTPVPVMVAEVSVPPAVEEPAPAAVAVAAESPAEFPAPRPEIAAALSIGWPNTVLRMVEDPHYKQWKRIVYWSAVTARKALGLATLTVPLSFFVYFLIGPVIRPAAVAETTLFGYISAIVIPGLNMADRFFSFRAVVHGWNLMFLILAAITLAMRAAALVPVMFLLRKVEALTKPRRQYAYVPFVPHRTEFH